MGACNVGLMIWGIDVGAFCLATALLPGFHAPDGVLQLILLAVVFATMSTLLRPIFWALTFPLLLVTVLPAILALNVLLIYMTAWIAHAAGVAFVLDGGAWVWLGAIGIGVFRISVVEALSATGRWRSYQRVQSMIRTLERTNARLERERDAWRKLADTWGAMLEGERVSAPVGSVDVMAQKASHTADVVGRPL